MTGKRNTSRRRERIEAMTDRQRHAFAPPNYHAQAAMDAAEQARDEMIDEAAADAIADGRANEADGWHVAPFDDVAF